MKITGHFVLTTAALIFWTVLFILSLVLIVPATMLFDAPGSEDSFITNFLFYSIVSFFPLIIISIGGLVFSYKKRRQKLTLLFAFLPLINLLSAGVAVALVFLKQKGLLY